MRHLFSMRPLLGGPAFQRLWRSCTSGGGCCGGPDDSADGCRALMRAIEGGRTAEARALLSSGRARADCRDPEANGRRRTPLHAAALHDRPEATRLLLRWLRDSVPASAVASALNARDSEGATPVYLAALEGRVRSLRRLLRAGAMPDLSNRLGRSPLHAACHRNWPASVRALIKGGAASNAVDRGQSTTLIKGGAAINAVDSRQSTPLHVAAHWGFPKPLSILLNSEPVDANVRNKLGWAAIHGAARRGHVSVVELLARKEVGANLDLQDNNGWSPLHHAADSGHEKAVAALLDAKVTVDQRESTQGVTSLHFAAHRGHLGVVRLLLESGASQTVVSNDGWTPLHVACRLRRSEVVRLLLQPSSAPVSARGRRNWTPLHVAAWNGDAGIVRCLLESGADRDAELTDSWAPLHLAAMSGRTEALEALLEHGANPMQPEQRLGWTPLDTAIMFHHMECALRLIGSCMTAGEGRHHGCFQGDPAPIARAERRVEDERSRNWRSDKTIDGHQLHAAMSAAGFVRPRATLQAAAADHLQALIGDYSSNQVRLCGSFAEGWGCSVSRLSGRVDEDSDIDVSEYFDGRPHHLEGRCRCPGRSVGPEEAALSTSEEEEADDKDSDDEEEEDASDGGVREATMLKYSQGHVEFSGYAAQPARTQYGSLGRPAMDMAVMYRCCNYPHIQVLDTPGHLPPELVAKLRKEADGSNACPLIGAALPGNEGRQLRVSTKWFELPIVRSFTDVQGQLYTILKYLVKRVINRRGGRLKSFHAKTLAFHMVRDTPPEHWRPERLSKLTESALDKLAEALQADGPNVGMRSFFFADAPLYLKQSTSDGADENATLKAVLETRKDLPAVLTAFADQLQPLRSNTGLDYHPFMLLPRSKQAKQLSQESRPQASSSAQAHLEYHELHEFVRCRLRDLAVGGSGGDGDLGDLLACLERMPDCARTTRECLAALACLRHDQPDKALDRLTELLATGHRPMRGLAPVDADDCDAMIDADGGADFVRRRLQGADSAWRFCFVQEPLRRSLRFDFLPTGVIRFPRRLLRYDDFYTFNFDALAKSLYLWLRRNRSGVGVDVFVGDDDALSRHWFNDMLDAEMDASEIELLVSSCRHDELLLRLVREHRDTLAQSRTVHCLLAERIKKSESLQRRLKQAFLDEL